MDNWKIIMSSDATTSFEVYLAKTCLESEGIETQLQNELAAQVYSSAADEAKLLVKESNWQGIKILTKGGYIKM